MTKLKLASVQDDRPVKLTISLPAALHRDLVAYAELLARHGGQKIEPPKLIAPMLEKFIASDRGFAKARKGESEAILKPSPRTADSPPPPLNAPD